jgi:23S rRNA G2445 N2-methylase RlmL
MTFLNTERLVLNGPYGQRNYTVNVDKNQYQQLVDGLKQKIKQARHRVSFFGK